MIDCWAIYPYIIVGLLIIGGYGLLAFLGWLVYYLVKRSGFLPNSEHEEFVIGIGIALILTLIAAFTEIPVIFKPDTWIQIYLLILTITIPAVGFILSFAANKLSRAESEEYRLTHPYDAIYRLTRARAVIFEMLIVFVGILILLILNYYYQNDEKIIHRILESLTLWASIQALILFIRVLNTIKNDRLIRDEDAEIVREKLLVPLDRLGIGTRRKKARDERE